MTVHGRVQGVFFRDSTRRRAGRNGVDGWVRNEPDGTVRAHLEGAEQDVEAVISWIRDGGPRRARVDHVESSEADPEGFEDFTIRR